MVADHQPAVDEDQQTAPRQGREGGRPAPGHGAANDGPKGRGGQTRRNEPTAGEALADGQAGPAQGTTGGRPRHAATSDATAPESRAGPGGVRWSVGAARGEPAAGIAGSAARVARFKPADAGGALGG